MRHTLRYLIFTISLLLTTLAELQALPVHKFTQYTSEDGLKENVVQCILQDHRGLMWFATWDGLYSFDGYRFRRHNTGKNGIAPVNHRIDQLTEDRYGYLWMLAYNGIVYCYDAQKEQYIQITAEGYQVAKISVMTDGRAWLETRPGDLLLAERDTVSGEVTVKDFFESHKLRKPTRINSVNLDSQGRHWILTEEGVFRYDCTEDAVSVITSQPCTEMVELNGSYFLSSTSGQLLSIKNGQRLPIAHQMDTPSSLKQLHLLPDHTLMATTGKDGFLLIDTKDFSARHITTQNCPELGDNVMQDVYVDYEGDLWLRTSKSGTVHYVPGTGHAHHFILNDVYGKAIDKSRTDQMAVEDASHNLWIHPAGGGLGWYDRAEDKLVPFYNPNLQNRWSNANKLTALYVDHQGNLWFGSYGNGLEKAAFSLYPFELLSYDRQAIDFSGNNVRAVYQDRDGRIWSGCKDDVVRVYSCDYEYLGSLGRDGRLHKDRSEELGLVYGFLQSRDGTIWIGTKGEGLLMLTEKGPTPVLRQYRSSDSDRYSLGSDEIYSLYEDRNGLIWIATFQNGINLMKRDASGLPDRFYNTRNELTTYPLIKCYRSRFVTGDEKGHIWIGTSGGLLSCNEGFSNPEDIAFTRYSYDKADTTSLNNDDVHGILRTRDGRYFVCTFGGGMSEMRLDDQGHATFHPVGAGQYEGQSSQVILSMQQDNKGGLWAASEDELSCFDLTSGLLTNYRSRLFPTRFTFNEGQSLALQDGELLFNTTRGLLHFNPDSVAVNSFTPPIHFNCDSLLLQPGNHSFTTEFAALDYVSPEAIEFAYRLKGFEQEWHYVGTQNTASYTNLPPGKYALEVRSTNSGGFWTDNVQSLPIEVLPTFSETIWAKALLALAILALLAAIIAISQIIYKLNHKVQIEEQLTDMKLKFFTNVSHELRTPLTLITGPLEDIMQRDDMTPDLKERLGIVSNNASKMSRLVTQLLDFRKIQRGKMHLVVENLDLVAFVGQQINDFKLLAEKMQIDLQYETKVASLPLWADADKLGQVINNLLSNAFKYSENGRPIHVTVEEAHGRAVFSVRDYGVGMNRETLRKLYDRFGSTIRQTPSGMASTGIGLSLTKELVELHHGTISVHSQPGVGSCFTVYLPLGRDHFNADTEYIVNDSEKRPENAAPVTDTETLLPTPVIGSDSTLLIVEDNDELRRFICDIFKGEYRVLEASDGIAGLQAVTKEMPDLVISDVMMPGMDGFGLAQQMRQNPELSHIPLILLTALADTDNKLHGLRAGIDDYITKPFSASYLKARVANILQKRQLLQQYYQHQIAALVAPNLTAKEDQQAPETEAKTQANALPITAADQKFIDIISAELQKNLSNANYSVDDMAQVANMSRSAFRAKVKAILGQPPSELLRDVRMKHAAELLNQGELNIAQIAYETGFSDPHYFSKCFKAYFGKTPSEYKN